MIPDFSLFMWRNPAGPDIGPETAIFWFRRDLRINDNRGLWHALTERGNVLPVFIFDTGILNALEDRDDARVSFIHQSLELLREDLHKAGGSLLVLHGDPVKILPALKAGAVYCNHDYEPQAIARDKAVAAALEKKVSHSGRSRIRSFLREAMW